MSVSRPISISPVAATSKRQNTSPPHISLARYSTAGSSNTGSKAGVKLGSKNSSKESSSYVNRLCDALLMIPVWDKNLQQNVS